MSAANAWWSVKVRELESIRPAHPHADLLAELDRRKDAAKAVGEADLAAEWERKRKAVAKLKEQDDADVAPASYLVSDEARTRYEAAQLLGIDNPDPIVIEGLYGTSILPPALPLESTIGGHAEAYLKTFDLRHQAGDLSAGENYLVRFHVQGFLDWIGPGNKPEVVTAERWEAYYRHLLGKIKEGSYSPSYGRKFWSHARRFLSWMGSMGIAPAPPNFARVYRFPSGQKAKIVFTDGEVKTLLENANGQLCLHLLLMLNCGFTQSDVSQLLKVEVDLKEGRITRQRSKTRGKHGDAVPEVSFKLWPETLTLLKRYMADHPTLALTTQQGKQWVEETYINGKLKSRDGVQSLYRHLQKATGIDKSLKSFRKTSPSKLKRHALYGTYRQHFLGHAPTNLADERYTTPSQEDFDAALVWLRTQYEFNL